MDRLWNKHVFVCTNQRDANNPRGCCGETRGMQTVAWFKEAIKREGLGATIRANRSGCMEACEAGPAVVVYPEAVWYRIQSQADVDRVVVQHLKGGQPVADLLLDFSPLPAWQARQK